MTTTLLAVSALWLLAAAGPEDTPPEPRNLQVFPEGTSRQELMPYMRRFSFALGVPCTHCHGTPDQTTSDLTGVDFSTDLKPTKLKARAMMRMVDEINQRLLGAIPDRSPRGVEVTCFTCHRHLSVPDQIEDWMRRRIAEVGVEAAAQEYRALRERTLGRGTWDFGEQPLVEVAADLQREEQYQAAAAVSRLNLEYHPESTQSRWTLAEALFALGRVAEARPLFEQVLERWAWHRGARARLEEIARLSTP